MILGLETSCDDTSLAVLEIGGRGTILRAHQKFSQDLLTQQWGGIIPEVSARAHTEKLRPLLVDTLKSANIRLSDITAIAFTQGPGLLGPLLTGLTLAKTISLIHQIPLIPVHHLAAHLEAIHLSEKISYPYLGLLVSGGHTALYQVSSPMNFQFLGGTLDDAAGEAFDKGAKILGLAQPGGPSIDRLAREAKNIESLFPIGMKNDPRPVWSFSGLKTSLNLYWQKKSEEEKKDPKILAQVCASYQEAIVDALVLKTQLAWELSGNILPLVVGGGVACNSRLREKIHQRFPQAYFVAPEFCTDNAGMVAFYASLTPHRIVPFPECLKLDSLSHPHFSPMEEVP